jgi:hypothetical protein
VYFHISEKQAATCIKGLLKGVIVAIIVIVVAVV